MQYYKNLGVFALKAFMIISAAVLTIAAGIGLAAIMFIVTK